MTGAEAILLGVIAFVVIVQSNGVLYDAVATGGFTGLVFGMLGGGIIVCLMLLAVIGPIGCALDLWMAWAMYMEGKISDA